MNMEFWYTVLSENWMHYLCKIKYIPVFRASDKYFLENAYTFLLLS